MGDYVLRKAKMSEMDAAGLFNPLKSASTALKSVVRTNALEMALAGQQPSGSTVDGTCRLPRWNLSTT